MKSISVKDTRENLSEILELVAGGNHSFIITKFGKPKAQIVPVQKKPSKKKSFNTDSDFVGMHKNRPDWKNKSSSQISSELRSLAWAGK